MRETISLNGLWDFMPVYEEHIDGIPDEIHYDAHPVTVPSSWRQSSDMFRIDKYGFDPFHMMDYPDEWNNAGSGVLHRKVNITEEQLQNKLVLCIKGVFQQAYVYWNGKETARIQDSYLPLYVDLTDMAKTGENDLCIVCTGYNSCILKSGKEKKTGLAGSWFYKIYRGVWQDVELYVIPKTNIADVEIITSVRKKKISVIAELESEKDRSLEVQVRIFDDTGEAKSFYSSRIGAGKLEISEDWENPVFWDTENPHLYNMELRLFADGVEVDSIKKRFGFREFWAEGEHFMLNGIRVNLRGDSWHFQGMVQQTKEYALNWCRICKRYGVNSIRYHANPHPEYYLDAADEEGILIVDETAIYGSGKSMDASCEEYLNNCRSHIRGLVRRDRNHPSVVIWSLENEMRWVDGRDEYKKHVPEFMEIFHKEDGSGRLISLDGDNRLIDKEHTEIASLHYNIDGTINQWDRKTPLTIGEHGGLWYICPQNSSMYMGLEAYKDHETCAKGVAIKEQLFMEYARRKGVSGISSFNFAYYFAESMPKEDIRVGDRTIKKNSLTINNGLLPEEYPIYSPNVTCAYAEAGMRPVTVIPREYDRCFFDGKAIERTLDIYNDTLGEKKVTLKIKAVQAGKEVYSAKEEFIQNPGETKTLSVRFMPEKAGICDSLAFSAEIYHDGKLMYVMEKDYKIYPSSLKTDKVSEAEIYYFGKRTDYEIISRLMPGCVYIKRISDAKAGGVLVLGCGLRESEQDLHKELYDFFKTGGKILILPQSGFTFGNLTISKKDFLRAHASCYCHPVLSGLLNDDFAYWHPHVGEYGPDPFISGAFEKPVYGDFNIILETSFGDFNDGGDLWTPLVEYKKGQGRVLACQIEVMENYDTVPQACILLRNMLSYISCAQNIYKKTYALVTKEDEEFLDAIKLSCQKNTDWTGGGLAVISPELIEKNEEKIERFIKEGGEVLCLPAKKSWSIASCGLNVTVRRRPVYQLWPELSAPVMQGISVTDMFGMDKVGMSPREVTNRYMAEYTVEIEGAKTLAESVEGTIWDDLFIDKNSGEYCKRALVAYKKELAQKPCCYIAQKGNIVISEFLKDPLDEKSVRVYTRLLSNMGAEFNDNALGVIKGEEGYAVESVMSLPYLDYQDYESVFKYYCDPVFSLNNLGEGLYGWMKKYERKKADGFITFTQSKGKTMFAVCFVHGLSGADKEYILDTKSNTSCEVYINGIRVSGGRVVLKAGINRVFVVLHPNYDVDLRLRMVFYNTNKTFATDLLYRTTVDEIDPK